MKLTPRHSLLLALALCGALCAASVCSERAAVAFPCGERSPRGWFYRLWCLLFFEAEAAIIHQGSFAVMIALFVGLSAWLELSGRFALPAVALLQAATFVSTWCVGNQEVHGAVEPIALALTCAAGAALASIIGFAGRAPAGRVAASH